MKFEIISKRGNMIYSDVHFPKELGNSQTHSDSYWECGFSISNLQSDQKLKMKVEIYDVILVKIGKLG
jgi:hypothetical protein